MADGVLGGGLGIFAYFGIAYVLSIDPLCLVFSRSRGLSGGDQIAAMVTPGNVWYCFKSFHLPRIFVSGVCLVCLSICGFRPGWRLLADRSLSRRERLLLMLVLACLWEMCFNLFYPMTFAGYIIPVLPAFLVVGLAYGRQHVRLWTILSLWLFLMACKDFYFKHYLVSAGTVHTASFHALNAILVVLGGTLLILLLRRQGQMLATVSGRGGGAE